MILLKRYLFKLSIVFVLLLFYIIDCSAVYVVNPKTNSTDAQGLCKYTLSNGYYVDAWKLDTNACVQTLPNGNVDPDGFKYFYDALYVRWKNVEANASERLVWATYHYSLLKGQTAAISVGPFTLNMPAPSFSSGTSFNIPCYTTTTVSISLNAYINTEANGIDQGDTITRSFEWTLPTDWKTTTGIGGTFVGSSSISVIPIASSLPVSIKVRAKANTQYSTMATLQITRNLNDFTILSSLPSPVLCNTTIRFTAPAATGVSYSWQLPTGWTGIITANYIDVVVKGASGSISCTMTGCNGPKTSTPLPITVNIIDPATTISGTSLVCSSGATFTLSSLPPGCTVLWDSGDLIEVSGQGTTTYRVKASGGNLETRTMVDSMGTTTVEEEPGGSTTIKATITNSCGSMCLPLMQKTVWEGFPGFRPVVTGPISINCGIPQTYLEQNQQAIYWSVPGSMQIIGSAGPGYRCTIKGLEFAAAGVIGTVSNACGSYSDILEVDIECSTLTIYPNPASSSIEVILANEVADTGTTLAKTSTPIDDDVMYTVRITNNYGIPFYTTQRTGNCFNIPVDNLKDGIYIVQVINGDNVYSQQLIVKH